MACQLRLLCGLPAGSPLVFDGIHSSCTSQDFPVQLHTLLDGPSELILVMTHAITRRGGRTRESQRRRIASRAARFTPEPGALSKSISLLVSELARFIDARINLLIDTDRHPLYARLLAGDTAIRHFARAARLCHRTTSSTLPRDTRNPLFPVNLVDRLLRHRMKEHTRETIAFARNATMQMHRAWIFAYDHNYCQPYRVGSGSGLTRAQRYGVSLPLLAATSRAFLHRRLDVAGLLLPESIRCVWLAELSTPPVRWRRGQKQSGPLIPAYARRDLLRAYLHAP